MGLANDRKAREVYELLRANRYVKNEQIRHMTLLSEPEIREVIHRLRASYNVPVCSSSSLGYFLPTTIDEGEKALSSLRARNMRISEAIRGMEKGLRKNFGREGRLF